MKKLLFQPRWALLLLLASVVLGVVGCGTTEPENVSSRPWDSPASWETGGLPSSLNQGH